MIEAILYPFRRLAMWAVWNVYLGRYATNVFDFAMAQKGRKGRCDKCGTMPIREILDGDSLCQKCCEKWARGERP